MRYASPAAKTSTAMTAPYPVRNTARLLRAPITMPSSYLPDLCTREYDISRMASGRRAFYYRFIPEPWLTPDMAPGGSKALAKLIDCPSGQSHERAGHPALLLFSR